MGDMLIVAVTKDAFVNKGPGRPVFNQSQRVQMLMALRCVNSVILVDSLMEALLYAKPDILVKGSDYTIDTIEPKHREFCEKNGIEIRFTTGEKLSSRALFKTPLVNSDDSRTAALLYSEKIVSGELKDANPFEMLIARELLIAHGGHK